MTITIITTPTPTHTRPHTLSINALVLPHPHRPRHFDMQPSAPLLHPMHHTSLLRITQVQPLAKVQSPHLS